MTSKLPIIIAEVGVNHNGKKELLKKFINKVSKANVDFIKFQSFISSNLVVKNSPKAKYQKKIKLTQYEMLKKYELKKSDYDLIFRECKKRKLKPFQMQLKLLENAPLLKRAILPHKISSAPDFFGLYIFS